jgi:type IV pilus assembly protein PilC
MANLKIYKYIATDKTNQQVVGTYKAETRDQVAEYLRSRELLIVSINEDISASFQRISELQLGGISVKERMLIAKQFSTMLQAGLPILQALEILSKQSTNKSVQDELIQVYNAVEGGSPLSQAFQKHSKIFSEIQINLLAAGEKSGNMIDVIAQIAVDLEKSNELTSKIRSAMIYPIIIFVAIIIVMAILMIFMIPTVESLYADFNALDKIPDITKFLIALSKFFSNPIGLIVTVLVIVVSVISFQSYKNTKAGRMSLAYLSFKIPVFGNLIQKIQLAQFGRLLAMLLRSGVSILDALAIVSKALSNPVYSKAVYDTIEEVSKGVPLAVPLAKTGIFPLLYIRMISTGEQTGNLDKVLADVGKFYDDEVNDITNNLTKLMEPLILLIVGGLVGFLAVAVYLPIYNIGNVIT